MIFLGADHQGYNLKEKIKAYLKKQNLKFADCGALGYNKKDDYPDFAKAVCENIVRNAHVRSQHNLGILICATGIGMSIAANKFKNIRAALCCNQEMAKQAREHNNANILCLGKNFDFKSIIKVFLTSKFTREKRHIRRLNKINI